MSEKQVGIAARLTRKMTAEIPAAWATALGICSTLGMLACAWWFVLREDTETEHVSISPSPEFVQAQRAFHANYRTFPNSNSRMFDAPSDALPLSRGSWLPSLDVHGWLNGKVNKENLAGKVLVIDVWDGTCPYCSLAAPALIAAYEKYHEEGVEFVGFTSANRNEASLFVDYWHLPWPSGFEATETIDALNAHAPTLFVVGKNGRVLWHDDRARWRHDYAGLGERLQTAIENALQLTSSTSLN